MQLFTVQYTCYKFTQSKAPTAELMISQKQQKEQEDKILAVFW